jgi:hypothetical protein
MRNFLGFSEELFIVLVLMAVLSFLDLLGSKNQSPN